MKKQMYPVLNSGAYRPMQRIAASDWTKLTPKLVMNSEYALDQVHHVRMLEHVTHVYYMYFALASRPISQCYFYNFLGYSSGLCCTYTH